MLTDIPGLSAADRWWAAPVGCPLVFHAATNLVPLLSCYRTLKAFQSELPWHQLAMEERAHGFAAFETSFAIPLLFPCYSLL